MADVKLLKVLVALEGEPHIFTCAAIEYEGKIWLVPRWIEAPDEGYTMPERIILLDQFAHQKLGQPGDPADFAVNAPIPKILFEGEPIPRELKDRFIVVERPDIKLRSSTLH